MSLKSGDVTGLMHSKITKTLFKYLVAIATVFLKIAFDIICIKLFILIIKIAFDLYFLRNFIFSKLFIKAIRSNSKKGFGAESRTSIGTY